MPVCVIVLQTLMEFVEEGNRERVEVRKQNNSHLAFCIIGTESIPVSVLINTTGLLSQAR